MSYAIPYLRTSDDKTNLLDLTLPTIFASPSHHDLSLPFYTLTIYGVECAIAWRAIDKLKLCHAISSLHYVLILYRRILDYKPGMHCRLVIPRSPPLDNLASPGSPVSPWPYSRFCLWIIFAWSFATAGSPFPPSFPPKSNREILQLRFSFFHPSKKNLSLPLYVAWNVLMNIYSIQVRISLFPQLRVCLPSLFS